MAQRDRAIIGAYVLALALFAVVAVLVFLQFRRYQDRVEWVQHTLLVITTVDEAFGQLKDVETGQRGYLLAGNEEFLEPYETAVTNVRERFEAVEALTADNPAQHARLLRIRPLVDEKIRFCQQTIAAYRAGQRAQAHAMVASKQGKRVMDSIRALVAQVKDEEEKLLMVRHAQARAMSWRTSSLLVFGNGAGFALLMLGSLVLGRELNRRRREEHEGSLRDERHLLQAQTTLAERRLQAVLDELPFAVVLADADADRPALRNARMRELARDAPIGFRRADGSPYDPGADPLARALREGAMVHDEELRIERGDGPAADVIAHASPVREEDGRILGAVGIFHDASEVRRAEAQRQDTERFRDVFLSALGHDLRNPLSVITVGAASLSRRVTSSVELKLVQRMASSAQRMTRMIDQLIDLVQARLGGGIVIERQRMDLGQLLRDVVDQIGVMHPERTVELTATGELMGWWDHDRLAEVARALIDNALEHGRSDTPVRVSVAARTDSVVIEFANHGNPISDRLLPLVFDPFRRAAERKRMKSSGLGIGLYLALDVVRAHGGTIDLSSAAESGTVFRVTLPRTYD